MKNKLLSEDILRFLKLAYFGNTENPFNAAGDRAYRDFCRTIDFPKSEYKLSRRELLKRAIKRQKCKDDIYLWLEESLNNIAKYDYDKWHEITCDGIIERFKSQALLTYGQAQKWLNMTMKYLLVFDNKDVCQLIPPLHVPIDNGVIRKAKKMYKLSAPPTPWSQWDKETYVKYQHRLRDKVSMDYCPIIWEFDNWEPPTTMEE
ncbi:MAG: hypothetical protein J6W88_01270 [Bacteroidales bacterium]|nr:hypothetical protein [Bacteroidales bacterium]